MTKKGYPSVLCTRAADVDAYPPHCATGAVQETKSGLIANSTSFLRSIDAFCYTRY